MKIIKMWAITKNGKLTTTCGLPYIYKTKKMAQEERDLWLDKEDYDICRCEINLLTK